MTTAVIGKPTSRLDGRKKVTGGATYAAEFDVPGQAHAAIVRSTIARGRIASIDAELTQRVPGVIVVLTHRNAPRLAYREHHAPSIRQSASASTCSRTIGSFSKGSQSRSWLPKRWNKPSMPQPWCASHTRPRPG